jgi:hypothetical protein
MQKTKSLLLRSKHTNNNNNMPIDYDLHTIIEEEEGECEELEDICIDDDDEQDDLAFDQQEQGAAIADPSMAKLRGAFESMKQLRASSNISREAWKKSVLADYSFDECDSQTPIKDLLVCLMLLVLLLCTTLVILLYAITLR